MDFIILNKGINTTNVIFNNFILSIEIKYNIFFYCYLFIDKQTD